MWFPLRPSFRLSFRFLLADDADASDWQDVWGAANTLLVPWVDMLNHSGDAGALVGTLDLLSQFVMLCAAAEVSLHA